MIGWSSVDFFNLKKPIYNSKYKKYNVNLNKLILKF